MEYHKKIHLVSFNQTIHAFIGDSNKCLQKALKIFKKDPQKKDIINFFDDSKNDNGYCQMFGDFTIIWCRSNRCDLIIHESIHATTFLFDIIGVKYTNDSHEVIAYTASNIASEIIEHVRKYSK